VDFNPSDCPYGVWKCEDPYFTLDINPQIDILVNKTDQAYSKRTLYSGDFIVGGEITNVYVSVFYPTNSIGIFYVDVIIDTKGEEKQGLLHTYYTIDGVIEVYSDNMIFLLSASYLMVDGRLRLRLSENYKEQFGIDYLYLDLMQTYEIPGKNDDQSR
jgi:hypothetical protein